MVRDEEAGILEWVYHHRLIGFDAIVVLDNRSTDRTAEVVMSASQVADVRLVPWPSTSSDKQMRAYEHVCARFAAEFDWIAFLDGDEFLMSESGEPVRHMLRRREKDAALAVGWLIYGSCGHVRAPDGLVMANFIRRAPASFDVNKHVKSIVRPGKVLGCVNPHFFAVEGRYVDPEGRPVAWEFDGVSRAPLAASSPWRVNHYFTRSAEHWSRRLQRRQPGTVVRTAGDFELYDRNEVLDRTAMLYVPRIEDVMDSLPVLAAPAAQREETSVPP